MTAAQLDLLDLLSRAVPERREQLAELFSKNDFAIRHVAHIEINKGEAFDPSPYSIYSRINVPSALYDLMWILTHGAWHAMRDYGATIISLGKDSREPITSDLIQQLVATLTPNPHTLETIDLARQLTQGQSAPFPIGCQEFIKPTTSKSAQSANYGLSQFRGCSFTNSLI